MKKTIYLTLVILLVFALASCASEIGDVQTPTTPSHTSLPPIVETNPETTAAPNVQVSTVPSEPAETNSETTAEPNVQVSTVPSEPVETSQGTIATPDKSGATTPVGVNEIDASRIPGKVRNVFYTNDNNTVLISADKLYLYDLATGKVLFETERESVSNENYLPTSDGYVMLGQKDTTSQVGGLTASVAPAFVAQYYDSTLKKLSAINLNDLIDEGEMFMADEIADASDNGNLLVFATNGALYLYDVSHNAMTKLIDCRTEDAAKRRGISIVEQAAFINGDKSVVLKAQSFDIPAVDGKDSFDTYGTIDIDGSNLTNSKGDGMEINYFVPSRNFTFVADDYNNSTGKVMVLDNATKKASTFTLTTKKESRVIFGSNQGAYFATSESTSNGLHIRVYDSATGKFVHEKVIKEDSLHMARDPVVKILDESKSLIVLLGNRQSDISTVVVYDSF